MWPVANDEIDYGEGAWERNIVDTRLVVKAIRSRGTAGATTQEIALRTKLDECNVIEITMALFNLGLITLPEREDDKFIINVPGIKRVYAAIF